MTLSPEAQRERLDKAVRPYLRKGWVLQSQADNRAQLTWERERGCLFKLLFGWNIGLLFPKKGKVLNFEVNPRGKVRKWMRKRHL